MNKIKLLSTEIIATIAAGQVIERPASVVKELIDNALDAAAQHITVNLQKGGLQRVTVIDDGFGMNEAELRNCFLSHTTSKLGSIEELQSLQTLGFRGEGLASMVVVADVEIASRPKDATVGSSITIKKGKLSQPQPVGMPIGTRVEVSHLFKHIPARKKFLKKEQTELRAVVDLISQYMLMYPGKTFVLIHNETVIARTQHNEILDRVHEVTHLPTDQLIPVTFEGEYVSITGFIGTPQLAKRTVHDQYIFVNSRHVSYPAIQKAVKESYRTLLEPYAQPPFCLFITVPPHMVDVNIDPKKEKLHIYHLDRVIKTLYEGIQDILSRYDIHYQVGDGLSLQDIGMESYTATSLRQEMIPWTLKDLTDDTEIAQLHKTYLVAPTSSGMIMIDQHAAHERILYEQFLAEFERQRSLGVLVALSQPKVIPFSVSEFALIIEYEKALRAHGFIFDLEMDQQQLIITKVPKLLQGRELKMLLLELCKDWQLLLPTEKLDLVSHKTLSYLACRTAIKAGEILTPKERRALLKKLANTKTQYTCPHGRPVQLSISLYEIEKMFHRK